MDMTAEVSPHEKMVLIGCRGVATKQYVLHAGLVVEYQCRMVRQLCMALTMLEQAMTLSCAVVSTHAGCFRGLHVDCALDQLGEMFHA